MFFLDSDARKMKQLRSLHKLSGHALRWTNWKSHPGGMQALVNLEELHLKPRKGVSKPEDTPSRGWRGETKPSEFGVTMRMLRKLDIIGLKHLFVIVVGSN
ncbi:unnamed protein product [Musa textilis]